MRRARIWVALIGIALPYVARLPGGIAWLQQYLESGLMGFAFISGFNAVAWLTILAASLIYQRPASLLGPALPGFAFLAWMHGTLNLGGDGQAGIALLFIPFYALLPIAIGGVVGYFLDRWLRTRPR